MVVGLAVRIYEITGEHILRIVSAVQNLHADNVFSGISVDSCLYLNDFFMCVPFLSVSDCFGHCYLLFCRSKVIMGAVINQYWTD